ncbi:hypothetical protein PPACK8108_LOCUS8193 [Phakopsora pachyrhizi]|uniref:Uncharacterized protein n=1 Tax=Phakopsora pachyrhizi TaxID=170000 RepID=A0AAV0AUA6_PHAPC|nr:hypothetical protein PPACK8108_LOCUS8193 [Phakopsora pachyrhizi]
MSGQCLQRHSSSEDRIKLRIEAELQPSDLKNCSDLNIFGNTELIDPQSIPGVCLRRNLHNSSSREVGLVCQRGSNTIQQIRRRNFNTLDSPNGIDPSSKVSTPPPPRPARSQKRLPLAECTRSIEDVPKLSTPLSLRSLNENLRGLLKTNKNQRSTREIYIQPKLTQGDERNRTLTFDSTLTSTGDTSQMFHTPISRILSEVRRVRTLG